MGRLRNSIRLRLATITTAVLAVFGVAVGAGTYVWLRTNLDEEMATYARHEASEVANVIAAARTEDDLRARQPILEEIAPDDGLVVLEVWTLTGELLVGVPHNHRELHPLWEEGLAAARRGEIPVEALEDSTLRTARLVRYANEPRWLIVAVVHSDHAHQSLARFLRAYALALVTALGVAFLGSLLLVRGALSPVQDLVADASRLVTEGPQHRLAVPGAGSELRELALLLNRMLAQIEGTIQQLKRFTSHAGHELRTPLARIRADAEAALRRPERQAETLGGILEEVEQLRHVLDGLLELARGEPLDLDREPAFPLEALAAELLDQAQVLGAERRVEVTGEVAPAGTVRGSRAMLSRALWNVLDNALKFARGRVRVAVSLRDDVVEVEVADDGPGIDPAQREPLFEPFRTGDAPSQIQGFGLGLALARSIARRHGGELLADPDPDPDLGGARFRLRLPRAPA